MQLSIVPKKPIMPRYSIISTVLTANSCRTVVIENNTAPPRQSISPTSWFFPKTFNVNFFSLLSHDSYNYQQPLDRYCHLYQPKPDILHPLSRQIRQRYAPFCISHLIPETRAPKRPVSPRNREAKIFITFNIYSFLNSYTLIFICTYNSNGEVS